jgi:hypothetical protein
MGPVTAETELAAVLGKGDLGEANDVRIGAFGGYLSLGLDNDKVIAGLAGGFGTGDAEPDDDVLKTFSFDRDFNRALILFEENLPTLEPGVMNSGERRTRLQLRPHEHRAAEPALPAADARLPPLSRAEGHGDDVRVTGRQAPLGRVGQQGLRSRVRRCAPPDPFPHAWFQARVGCWMPGRYFSEYGTDTNGTYGFERPSPSSLSGSSSSEGIGSCSSPGSSPRSSPVLPRRA